MNDILTDEERKAVIAAIRDAKKVHDATLRDLGRKHMVTAVDGSKRDYHDEQSKILTGVLVKLNGGVV